MSNIYISASKIHGEGLFANKDFVSGENICLVIDLSKSVSGHPDSYISDVGRKVNHQFNPHSNSKLVTSNNIHWHLISTRPIKKDEEITSNYHEAPPFIKRNTRTYK